MPRYLAATRPGTRSVVSEIDGGVVRIDYDELGLPRDAGIEVRVEDGRLGLRELESDSRDLVVGDAFGGVAVPWHLTTVEAVSEVHRILDADGVYVANLIDYGNLGFARAQVATLRDVFEHVVVLGEPNDLGLDPVEPIDGGNMVVVASDRHLDLDAVRRALDAESTGWTVSSGDDLARWVGDAVVLRDDHAPVDQLLEPTRPARS